MNQSSLSLKIIEKIGAGGMGLAYLAYLTGENGFKKKVLAKKVIDSSLKDKLLAEAKLQAELSHPNISQILDIRKIEDDDYIVTEFIEGENLKSFLDRHRVNNENVSLEIVEKIFWQIVEAITYLHSKSIIHGDLTPSNIMITKDFHVKVIDFGLSVDTFDIDKTIYTENLIGTIDYLSPERLENQRVSKSSDVFALGIILVELLTLKNPFKQSSPIKTIESIRSVSFVETIKFDSENNMFKIAFNLLEKDYKKRIKINELKEVSKSFKINEISVSNGEFKQSLNIMKYKLHASVVSMLILFGIGFIILKKHYSSEKFTSLAVTLNSVPVVIKTIDEYSDRSVDQCNFMYRKYMSNSDLLTNQKGREDYLNGLRKGDFQAAVINIVRLYEKNQNSFLMAISKCKDDTQKEKVLKLYNANLTMFDYLIKSKSSSVEDMHKAGFTDKLLYSSYNSVFGFEPYEGYFNKSNNITELYKSSVKTYDKYKGLVLVEYPKQYSFSDLDDCRSKASDLWVSDRIISITNLTLKDSYHLVMVPQGSSINYKNGTLFLDLKSESDKICEFKIDQFQNETVTLY